MLTSRIIIGFIVVLLAIQILPVRQSNDYDDDSSETCISIITNNDVGDLINLASLDSPALSQQIIFLNRFYGKCKILPGFPVCIYLSFLTDVLTPPPDKAALNFSVTPYA